MKTLNILYQRNATTGLLAATSPDLPGFMVVGRSMDELIDEVPVVAADLIKKQTGENVEVVWNDEPANATGFSAVEFHEAQVRHAA